MHRFLWLTLAIPVLVGCKDKAEKGEAPAPESPALSAAAQEARTTFKTVCAVCHCESGKGDGIGATNLDPKPRNYTDAAWQKSVTDGQIKQIIVYGGTAVGKSAVMPAHAQLAQKPEVVDELVRLVRAFGK